MSSRPRKTDVPFPVLVPTLQISFYKPVPVILSARPSLIAYYRLLLGFSQKELYKSPFGVFARMESASVLSEQTRNLLPDLCRSMIGSAGVLLNGVPALSTDLLNALTLLTLGSQLRGSYNTIVGQEATKNVFQMIRQLVHDVIEEETMAHLLIRNAAGRLVRIEFAPDPDIAIREQLGPGRYNNRIALEIKGGTDVSNLHNRLGEAEKSHQNARLHGFTQFWTIINVSRLDGIAAHNETPTTTRFFLVKPILDTTSSEHEEFRLLLRSELGLAGD